jgi:hypothetical protein
MTAFSLRRGGRPAPEAAQASGARRIAHQVGTSDHPGRKHLSLRSLDHFIAPFTKTRRKYGVASVRAYGSTGITRSGAQTPGRKDISPECKTCPAIDGSLRINSPDAGVTSPCAVDLSDLSALAERMGYPSLYDFCFDYNDDGAIDAGDLALFASALGVAPCR